jgi:glycosyltransferase involved in cell wall biosynthesis
MKTKKPLITIITVVYNGIETIEQTILSVVNQTYSNIEYIIIDGYSNDGTINIIKKHESKIAYWISESDKGIYDAMNKGIEKATGEWINFMNSGDWFFNYDTISLLFERNDFSEYDLIYGNTHKRYPNERYIKRPDVYWKLGITHQSIFSRSYLNKKYKFDLQYKIAADFDFIFKVFSRNYKTIYINETIASMNMIGVSYYYRYIGFKEDRSIILKYQYSFFLKIKSFIFFLIYLTLMGKIVDNMRKYFPKSYIIYVNLKTISFSKTAKND